MKILKWFWTTKIAYKRNKKLWPLDTRYFGEKQLENTKLDSIQNEGQTRNFLPNVLKYCCILIFLTSQ